MFLESIFGARVRSRDQACLAGGVEQLPVRSTADGGERNPTEALARILDHYSDPGKFDRMPIVVQSGVCDSFVGLINMATGDRELQEARQFVHRHGLPHHIQLLESPVPPPPFRYWSNFSFFARNQRIWQIRIFRASQTLRQASSVASGTDELAQLIARQITREVTGATYVGQVYTAPRGRQGRPPAIEASVSYGVASRGLVALDGKDPVTEKDVLKVANDCRAAAQLHEEYRWVQPVLVLPCGCDVRSSAVLQSALLNRVIIATTALPTRPLGLSMRNAVC